MKFGKTYLESLEQVPEEWRQQAIEYRKLKKVINRVASELEELGLTSEVLRELLEDSARRTTSTSTSTSSPPRSTAALASSPPRPTRTLTRHGSDATLRRLDPVDDDDARDKVGGVHGSTLHFDSSIVASDVGPGRDEPEDEKDVGRSRIEEATEEDERGANGIETVRPDEVVGHGERVPRVAEDDGPSSQDVKGKGKGKRVRKRRVRATYELAGTSEAPEPRIHLVFSSASSSSCSSTPSGSEDEARFRLDPSSSTSDQDEPGSPSRFLFARHVGGGGSGSLNDERNASRSRRRRRSKRSETDRGRDSENASPAGESSSEAHGLGMVMGDAARGDAGSNEGDDAGAQAKITELVDSSSSDVDPEHRRTSSHVPPSYSRSHPRPRPPRATSSSSSSPPRRSSSAGGGGDGTEESASTPGELEEVEFEGAGPKANGLLRRMYGVGRTSDGEVESNGPSSAAAWSNDERGRVVDEDGLAVFEVDDTAQGERVVVVGRSQRFDPTSFDVTRFGEDAGPGEEKEVEEENESAGERGARPRSRSDATLKSHEAPTSDLPSSAIARGGSAVIADFDGDEDDRASIKEQRRRDKKDQAAEEAAQADDESAVKRNRRRRRPRQHRKEVFIPLNSDSEFLTLLASALNSLATLQLAQKRQFTEAVSLLAREVSRVSSPDRPKSDLYIWREIFSLWVEAAIFESDRERDRGERSVEDAEKKLDWFVDQVAKRKLAKRMRNKESRVALEKFVALNVELLDLKKFQVANEEAARKILKKHDKRTALTASLGFPKFIAAATNLSSELVVSPSTGQPERRVLTLPGFPSLPHILLSTFTSTLLPVIPQLEDYECSICGDVAFKPIRLGCGHKFCVRCLVKMQKRGQDNCPQCRSAVVLRANATNLDQELQRFLVKWFPHEVKEKEKANYKEAAREELEEMGIHDRKCVVM